MDRILNFLIPGTGLILRNREWLGFSLSIIFGVCGNIAIAGWLIAPEAIPMWLVLPATGLSAGAWGLAQILFWRQGKHCDRRPILPSVLTGPETRLSSPKAVQRL